MSFMNQDAFVGTPVREVRRARLVRGTLRTHSGNVIPILVRNLSERGLGVTCKTRPPARGETVAITLPGLPEHDGVVRWVRDRAFGIELSDTVAVEDLATAIRAELARISEAADWTVSSLHRVREPQTSPRRMV